MSELVKTIGGIAQRASPQVQNIGEGATEATLRGSLHGLASGVTAVTEEDAAGKSPTIEKRPASRCAQNHSIHCRGNHRRSGSPKMREAAEKVFI